MIFWEGLFYCLYDCTKDHEEEVEGPEDTAWVLESNPYFLRRCRIQRLVQELPRQRAIFLQEQKCCYSIWKSEPSLFKWNNLIKWSWNQILSRTGRADVWSMNGIESHSLCRLRIFFHLFFWLELSKYLCVVEWWALSAGVRGTSSLLRCLWLNNWATGSPSSCMSHWAAKSESVCTNEYMIASDSFPQHRWVAYCHSVA